MHEINLFDSNFVGQSCSVALQTPRLMRYVRGQMEWPGVTVFTDRWMYDPIVDDVQSRFKIGWLHEGKALHPENYERIHNVRYKFDAIMTHDAELIARNPDFFLKTIRGGSWVALDQWGMYPKTKNVSMILSEKTQLEGHKLRHAIAQAGLPIDVYGPQPFLGGNKALAYKDYRFAVVVEACKEDNFFSEHLIDALAFGCVPIYWGCPNIFEWLNGGVMKFQNVKELSNTLDIIGQDWEGFYEADSGYVELRQHTARQYAVTEDWQVVNCLRPYLEAQ